MKITYALVGGVLLILSTLLGLFLLGSAGLGTTEKVLSFAVAVWAVLSLASMAGVVYAVDKLSTAWLLVASAMPLAAALALSKIALILGGIA